MSVSKSVNFTSIYHCTTPSALYLILAQDKLLTSADRQKLNIATVGQGGLNRKTLMEHKYDPNFIEMFSEVNGLFFRIVKPTHCHQKNKSGAVLQLTTKVLDDYEWYVNSSENNGFFCNNLGQVGINAFTGDECITYDKTNIDNYLNSQLWLDQTVSMDAELVITQSIPVIKYLQHIIFFNLGEYKQFIKDFPNLQSKAVMA